MIEYKVNNEEGELRLVDWTASELAVATIQFINEAYKAIERHADTKTAKAFKDYITDMVDSEKAFNLNE